MGCSSKVKGLQLLNMLLKQRELAHEAYFRSDAYRKLGLQSDWANSSAALKRMYAAAFSRISKAIEILSQKIIQKEGKSVYGRRKSKCDIVL